MMGIRNERPAVVRIRASCDGDALRVSYEVIDADGRTIDGEEVRLDVPCSGCSEHGRFTDGCMACYREVMARAFWNHVYVRMQQKIGPAKVLGSWIDGGTLVVRVMLLG